MRAVLDACVLFPTVLREILLGVAAEGIYRPLWSGRIIEEWCRATRRIGPEAEARARADAALICARFPEAMLPAAPGVEARLHLPDPDDRHVLAVAVAAGADALVTLNTGDFPLRVLAGEGIVRREPDGLLWEFWSHHPEAVARVIAGVHARAETAAGREVALRGLLRRARLPRLGRALAG
ncbi:MAG: PIN domain-containing protein [Gemmobacter sp.]